jgi:hypothetical protein
VGYRMATLVASLEKLNRTMPRRKVDRELS